MRTFILATLLCSAMSSTFAADKPPLTPDALQAFRGTFDLEDGQLLAVSQHGRKLYAQINGGPTLELVGEGAATFRAVSGNTRLEFRQYPNGSVTSVRLSRSPS
jgi:hypothetical protein